MCGFVDSGNKVVFRLRSEVVETAYHRFNLRPHWKRCACAGIAAGVSAWENHAYRRIYRWYYKLRASDSIDADFDGFASDFKDFGWDEALGTRV